MGYQGLQYLIGGISGSAVLDRRVSGSVVLDRRVSGSAVLDRRDIPGLQDRDAFRVAHTHERGRRRRSVVHPLAAARITMQGFFRVRVSLSLTSIEPTRYPTLEISISLYLSLTIYISLGYEYRSRRSLHRQGEEAHRQDQVPSRVRTQGQSKERRAESHSTMDR